MKVKELQKTVNIAWSPKPQHPTYMVVGTAAQQLDSNINSSLEIYSTNFTDPSYDLELKASLPSPYRFQKLIWSPTGFGKTHQNGLIVGGCEGGHIMIYSAAKMLAKDDGLIARQDKHSGAVCGLDFNPFQNNLLASCATESEIFIWDLNNTTTHMNPGAKTQPLEDVKNVAWNRQVQHILASVFSTRCVIWDLRKSEQIIKLSDTQSRVRWHAIQWHPDVATQVWLASEDDQAPVCQLWDLRYATAPAKTIQVHQRGVLGMSWCPDDIDLMVSCAKDNRIFCWNPNTQKTEGEILSEVATTATWYSDVQWCPRNPALIASSSLDGNVSIYSLLGGTQQQVQTSNKIADSFPGMDTLAQAPLPQQTAPVVYQDLKYAPKWIKQPCGVAFGFGGKLVSFNNKNKTVVTISQITTEPALVERAQALEKSLNGGTNCIDYCREKADQMSDQNGRYLWYFIKANFERNPKEEMLNLLGFNKEDIDLKHNDVNDGEGEQSTDDSLTNYLQTTEDSVTEGNEGGEGDKVALPSFKIPTGEEPDSLIAEALLTGHVETAAQMCLDTNRTAEALIIAATAGIEFLQKIQYRYLQQQQQRPQNDIAHLIAALVTRDWLDFVNRCNIASWKEALVAALKHGERKVTNICEKLGERLLNVHPPTADSTRNAIICFICAGSMDKLISAWYKLKQLEHTNKHYKLNATELQELAEIIMLMKKSLDGQGIAIDLNDELAKFIMEYGGLLVAQGAFSAALTYIMEIKSVNDHKDLEDLRQRIANIVQPQRQTQIQSNHFNRQQQQQQQQQFPLAEQQMQQQQQHLSRASFSQPLPTNSMYYPNMWQTNAVGNNGVSSVATAAPAASTALLPPPIATVANKFQTNEPFTQPPRPLSTASSQDGNSIRTASSLHSRTKYVLDPSVAGTASNMGAMYGNTYTPAPMAATAALSPNNFPTNNQYNGNATNLIPNNNNSSNSNCNSYTNIPYQNSAYMTTAIDSSSAAIPPPPPPPMQANVGQQQQQQHIQRNPTPPPGWNDPPTIKSNRTKFNDSFPNNEMSAQHAGTRRWQQIINHISNSYQKTSYQSNNISNTNSNSKRNSYRNSNFNFKTNFEAATFNSNNIIQQSNKVMETASMGAPITHPLFGIDPNQMPNGTRMMDSNNQYQQQQQQQQQQQHHQQNVSNMMGGGLPPPPNTANPNPNMPTTNIMQPSMSGGGGGGGAPSPYNYQSNNNLPAQSLSMQFQSNALNNTNTNIQQQQQTNPNSNPNQFNYGNNTSSNNTGSINSSMPAAAAAAAAAVTAIKEKPPLPEQFIYLQTVLEELKSLCLTKATDARMKRKFVDVAKRLENLYDCLRDNKLTIATVQALNQIVQYLQISDYPNALQTHTQIAFGSDFSQCAGFMPGLKVLIQSANELQVYLR